MVANQWTEQTTRAWIFLNIQANDKMETSKSQQFFKLANFHPNQKILSLIGVFQALATFAKMEIFLRGSHMAVLNDFNCELIYFTTRHKNIQAKDIYKLIEDRIYRFKAITNIQNLDERVEATFTFDQTSNDALELKEKANDFIRDNTRYKRSRTNNDPSNSSNNQNTSSFWIDSTPNWALRPKKQPPPPVHGGQWPCYAWVKEGETPGKPCKTSKCRNNYPHDWNTIQESDKTVLRDHLRNN